MTTTIRYWRHPILIQSQSQISEHVELHADLTTSFLAGLTAVPCLFFPALTRNLLRVEQCHDDEWSWAGTYHFIQLYIQPFMVPLTPHEMRTVVMKRESVHLKMIPKGVNCVVTI